MVTTDPFFEALELLLPADVDIVEVGPIPPLPDQPVDTVADIDHDVIEAGADAIEARVVATLCELWTIVAGDGADLIDVAWSGGRVDDVDCFVAQASTAADLDRAAPAESIRDALASRDWAVEVQADPSVLSAVLDDLYAEVQWRVLERIVAARVRSSHRALGPAGWARVGRGRRQR